VIAAANLLLVLSLAAPDAGADASGGGDAGVHVDGGADAGDVGVRIEAPRPPPPPPAVSVTGVVLAMGSPDVVPAVGLAVDGQPAAETDGDGRFQLRLSPGRHTIQIQHPGFLAFTEVIDAGKTAELTLRLTPTRAPGEYETVVRPPPREAPQLTLEKSEITMTPGSLGDPFRVIESLPGVVPVLWPLPIYAVRGSNPGNTGYFVDGLRVPALFHFALGPAVIHPQFLDNLTFYPSAYPPGYGRYVGGVVVAETSNAPNDRFRGSVDVRLYDAAVTASTPFNEGKGTASAAARYAYPGAMLSLLQEEVDLHYWDYQVRVDHPLGPGRLSVLALGSYDSLTVTETTVRSIQPPPGSGPGIDPETEEDKEKVALTFHRVDLRWRAPLGGGRLLAGLGAGYDRTSAPYDSNADVSVSGRSLLPRVVYDRGFGVASGSDPGSPPALLLTVGADGELTDYDALAASIDPTRALGALRARSAILLGAHAGLTLRAGERFVASPGLRVDSYRESGAHALDVQPRLHLRYRIGGKLWLKASGGRATQLPSIPLQIPGFEGFGLPRHGLQHSWQTSVGAERPLFGGLELDATAYAQRMRLTDMRDPEAGSDPALDFLVSREALSYGLELLVRRPPRERLHGWLSYTLSKALRAFEGGVVSAADWDQRHVVNLVVGYRWRRYTLGGRFHLHTGRQVRIGGTSPVEFGRLPAFYQLDLRLDRRFLFDSATVDLYIELVNSTLTTQVVDLYRDTGAGPIREDGFRLVLPSLGVRVEF
jgi:hypothetical protein